MGLFPAWQVWALEWDALKRTRNGRKGWIFPQNHSKVQNHSSMELLSLRSGSGLVLPLHLFLKRIPNGLTPLHIMNYAKQLWREGEKVEERVRWIVQSLGLDGSEASEVDAIEHLWGRRQYLRWNPQWFSCLPSTASILTGLGRMLPIAKREMLPLRWHLHMIVLYDNRPITKQSDNVCFCSTCSQCTPSVYPDGDLKGAFALLGWLFKAKLAAKQHSELKGGCWHSKSCPTLSLQNAWQQQHWALFCPQSS